MKDHSYGWGFFLLWFWVNVFYLSERYMIEEGPLKRGDQGDNLMRSYVERNALFWSKLWLFLYNYLSNVPGFTPG